MIKIILLVFPVTEKFISFFENIEKAVDKTYNIHNNYRKSFLNEGVLSCIKKQKQRSLILSSRATQFTAGFSEVIDKKKSADDEKKYCPYCGHKIEK